MNFTELGLSENIVIALKKQNITEATSIQEKSFGPITEGRDFIGESYTGTGKTLAYLLPVYERIVKNNITGNYVLILTPTHELAIQVLRQIEELSKNSGCAVTGTVIMGNVNINRQLEALKSKPQFIIGTAGRIYELIKKKKIAAHLVKYLVVDEADKLLDQNNINDTLAVRKCLMKDAQVVIFSASITDKTVKSTINLLCEPAEIRIKEEKKSPASIEHYYIVAEKKEKPQMLRRVIGCLNAKKALVYINKVYDINEATDRLKYHNINAECIYGEVDKITRKNRLDGFKKGSIRVLVATDLAARGLQIDGVDLVVSYSMPENSNEYLHRAGRTGRNGKKGVSISIVTPGELKFITQYNKDLGINIEERILFKGKLVKEKL